MTQRFATEHKKLLDFIQWSVHEYRVVSAYSVGGSKYSSLCQINQKMLEIFLQDLQGYTSLCQDLDQNLGKSSESFQILIQEIRNFSIEFSELINNEVNTVESLAKDFATEHCIDLNSFVWIEDETCANEVGLLRFSNKQRLSAESFNYNGVCSKSTCGEFFHFSSIYQYSAQVLARCKQLARVLIIFQLACEKHWSVVEDIVKVLLASGRNEVVYSKIEKKMTDLGNFQEKMRKSYIKVQKFGHSLGKQINLVPKETCLRMKTIEIKKFLGERLRNLLYYLKNWLEKLETLTLAEVDSRQGRRKLSVNEYQPASASYLATPLFYKYFNMRLNIDKRQEKDVFVKNTEKILKKLTNKSEKAENITIISNFLLANQDTGKNIIITADKKKKLKESARKNFSIKYSYTLKNLNLCEKNKFEGYKNVLSRAKSTKRITTSEKSDNRAASTQRVLEEKIPNRLALCNQVSSSRFNCKFPRSRLVHTINNKKVLTMSLH